VNSFALIGQESRSTTERTELKNWVLKLSHCQLKQSNCLNHIHFRADTLTQSIASLIHCSVYNVLIKVTSVFNQSLFQKIFDAINVLVSARSATSTTAGLRSADPVVSVLCSTRFTNARDPLFSRKFNHESFSTVSFSTLGILIKPLCKLFIEYWSQLNYNSDFFLLFVGTQCVLAARSFLVSVISLLSAVTK